MNRKHHLQRTALLLILLLLVGIVAGCAGQATTQATTKATTPGTTGTAAFKLPIVDKPITLKWFTALHSISALVVKSYGEVEAMKELVKRTGINIEWNTPATGFADQLNLMIASQDLPDLVGAGFSAYKGGITQALNDGVAIKLNDIVDKQSVYLKKILSDFPQVAKELKTDDGDIIYTPKLYFLNPTTPGLHNNYGPCMRKDWLDKLGLKVPTTIDEWYTVLKAFKEKDPNGNSKQDEIPFIIAGGGIQQFYGAWGYLWRVCLKADGKVTFGCIEPEFKDYLTTMNKWYKEGLIYQDYLTGDQKKMDQLVAADVAGSTYTWDAYLAGFIETAGPVIKGFNMMQVPWPKGPNGKCEIMIDQMKNNRVTGIGISITSKCKNPVEAFKMIDYLYSKDGLLLTNMGIEGLSYKMVNGEPQYLDVVLKDPTGLSPDAAMSKYAVLHSNGVAAALVSSYGSKGLYSKFGDLYKNFEIWGNGGKNTLLPMISLKPAESSAATVILADINTYINEHINKMIMGQEPLSNFDKFVTDIKNMKVDQLIKTYQDAVDRFNNRK